MATIKREAGDKTKGFTLQTQRAIALLPAITDMLITQILK